MMRPYKPKKLLAELTIKLENRREFRISGFYLFIKKKEIVELGYNGHLEYFPQGGTAVPFTSFCYLMVPPCC